MELDDYPDMSGEHMNYLPTTSDGLYLLPNSSSRGLTSVEQKNSVQLPGDSISDDFVSLSSLSLKVNTQSGRVISKIEDILQQVVDCILDEKKELVLHLKPRIRSGNEALDAHTGAIKTSSKTEARTIKFPGRTAQEAWKFSR
jgi:hypothetical protein